jgi:nitrite reductase/ring-hydroxylating ferredoxin subunit
VSEHRVCNVDDLGSGKSIVVEVERRRIVIANCDGNLYAIRDVCPHQGCALSKGSIGGTLLPSDPHTFKYGLEGRVIRCPWHAWEFDLKTGESIFDPTGTRVRTYPVHIDGDAVIVVV